MEKLKPYGSINDILFDNSPAARSPELPIADFKGSRADYEKLFFGWFDDMKTYVWPEWKQVRSGWDWDGGAVAHAQDATYRELAIIKTEFQDGNIMNNIATIGSRPPMGDVEHRTHQWHYDVEDAQLKEPGSKDFETLGALGPGANFLGYWPKIKPNDFHTEFWYRNRSREPNVLSIKLRFQRPRPWTTAWAFGITDFRWRSGGRIKHTGVHPAFLSGHCYQGLIHSANVLQNWRRKDLDAPAEQIAALRQYAVDWGDRRVFAGVHYLTDNVSSWILAMRVARGLFDDDLGNEIIEFFHKAITDHSLVYAALAEGVRDDVNASLRPAFNLLQRELGLEVEPESPQPSKNG